MKSHEREEHKDKKHIVKIIRKNPNITGAYYSQRLDRSKKIIQIKNSTEAVQEKNQLI